MECFYRGYTNVRILHAVYEAGSLSEGYYYYFIYRVLTMAQLFVKGPRETRTTFFGRVAMASTHELMVRVYKMRSETEGGALKGRFLESCGPGLMRSDRLILGAHSTTMWHSHKAPATHDFWNPLPFEPQKQQLGSLCLCDLLGPQNT